jgi:release factor glutamine methyltransferase
VSGALTVSALLRATPLDALDARVLLCHALAWHRTALITRSDEPLDDMQAQAFRALEQRRLNGEPVAQLVGAREFYGRSFLVTPDVLIPRPDTELLVEMALAAMDAMPPRTAQSPPCRVLDLGTGSGAIAVTLAAERPWVEMVATDRSAEALALAQRNAAALLQALPSRAGSSASIRFLQGDWFEALRETPPVPAADADATALYDLIVSNPPYIARNDPHLSIGDLRFEPQGALTDHGDGLGAIRRIVADASDWLRPHASLMIEHGYDQGGAVRQIFADAGFDAIQTTRDLGGQERVTTGQTTRSGR